MGIVGLGPASSLRAQEDSVTAIVTGTERVFVRRGPGNEFQPFASIPSGSTVEIQEMRGDWARITTASGQVGFIHSKFLSRPGEEQRRPTVRATPTGAARPTRTRATEPTRAHTASGGTPAAPTNTRSPRPPTATPSPRPASPTQTQRAPTRTRSASPTRTETRTPTPTRTPTETSAPTRTRTPSSTRTVGWLTVTAAAAAVRTATAAQEEATLRSAAERNRELEAEVLALRQELAALRQRTGSPGATDGVASCPDELRTELARLTAAVEVMQRRNILGPPSDSGGAAPLPATLDTGTHAISPLVVFFGAGGIFLGWLLGSRYARKQERNRRLRF